MELAREMRRWSRKQHRLGPRGAELMLDVIHFTNWALIGVDDFSTNPLHNSRETLRVKKVLERLAITLDQAWHFLDQYVDRFISTRFTGRGYDLRKDFNAAYDYFLDRIMDIWLEEALHLSRRQYLEKWYEEDLDEVHYYREERARVAGELWTKYGISDSDPLVTQLRGACKPWKPLDDFHDRIPNPFASEYLRFALNECILEE
jgi:hypothetical protein